MSNHGIEVRNLQKFFRKRRKLFRARPAVVHALRDISFEVELGETYGLLGPNGAGKSTLIRVLSTLLVPDGGEVRLLGHRIPGEELSATKIGRVAWTRPLQKLSRAKLLSSAYLSGMDGARRAARVEILEALGLEHEKSPPPLRLEPLSSRKSHHARPLMTRRCSFWTSRPPDSTREQARRADLLEDLLRAHGTTIPDLARHANRAPVLALVHREGRALAGGRGRSQGALRRGLLDDRSSRSRAVSEEDSRPPPTRLTKATLREDEAAR